MTVRKETNMRKVINVNANDPMYQGMISKAMEAMKPENLRIVVRSQVNKKEEITPLERFGLYFYVAGKMEDAIAFNGKYTADDVINAVANTEKSARIGSMFDVLAGEGKSVDEWEPDGEPMIILTNRDKSNGAGVIFCDGILKKIHEKVGDFYVLPSSIHEVIIVPEEYTEASTEDLREMVMEVNRTQVSEDDYLSDHVFKYDGQFLY